MHSRGDRSFILLETQTDRRSKRKDRYFSLGPLSQRWESFFELWSSRFPLFPFPSKPSRKFRPYMQLSSDTGSPLCSRREKMLNFSISGHSHHEFSNSRHRSEERSNRMFFGLTTRQVPPYNFVSRWRERFKRLKTQTARCRTSVVCKLLRCSFYWAYPANPERKLICQISPENSPVVLLLRE